MDLCCHLTVSVPARNCRGCIFCCSLKFVGSLASISLQRCAVAVGQFWIARRWREARLGSDRERENLAGDGKGKGSGGSNRGAKSTDAPDSNGVWSVHVFKKSGS